MATQTQSFKRGFSQVPLMLVRETKTKIMHRLGLTSNMQWYRKLRGQTTLSPAEAAAVESIFNDIGITNIWGEDLQKNDWDESVAKSF